MHLHTVVPQPPLLTNRQSILNPTKQKLEPEQSDSVPTITHNKIKTPIQSKGTPKKSQIPFEKKTTKQDKSKKNVTQKETITWEEFLAPPELNPEQQILHVNILPPSFDALFSELSTQKQLTRRTTLSDFPVIPTIFNGVNLSISTYNSIVSTGSVFPIDLLPLAPPHAPSVQWMNQNVATKDWISCQPPCLL